MSILFPAYLEDEEITEEQKIPREYGVDFDTGQLTGEIVEGLEAIKVWIWLVLQTPRYRYYIYTWDHGNEFEDLIGKGYTEEYMNTEIYRMTEECLLMNEDIQSISDFCVEINHDRMTVSFKANTIYGELEIAGQTIAGGS